MKNNQAESKLTLPNLLTGFRFLAAPGLLWLAWHGYQIGFMALLAAGFLSDLLDGMVARWMGLTSEFGAILDSWADVINYLTIAVGCWWLWPEIVTRELLYVGMIITSCLLPALAGFSKFGCFTSYHTWSVKMAAACMGISLYILFFGGPVWPFRMAAYVCVMAACEEILITWLLPSPRSNVKTIWRVIKSRH